MNEKAKPIRALLDVIGSVQYVNGDLEDKIPKKLYGRGAAAKTRYLVMIAIAANADPDGTGAHPCIDTIAQRAMCSRSTAKRAIVWLIEHGLLRKKIKAVPIPGTTSHLNLYEMVFPDPEATGQMDDPLPAEATGHIDDPLPEEATAQNGHSNGSNQGGQRLI